MNLTDTAADGISNNYIDIRDIVERNLFFRLYYCSQGLLSKATGKKLFQSASIAPEEMEDLEKLTRFYFAYEVFRELFVRMSKRAPNQQSRSNFAKIYAMTLKYFTPDISKIPETVKLNIENFRSEWELFEVFLKQRYLSGYGYSFVEKETEDAEIAKRLLREYQKGQISADDIQFYFGQKHS